jgi:hypothetical protein
MLVPAPGPVSFLPCPLIGAGGHLVDRPLGQTEEPQHVVDSASAVAGEHLKSAAIFGRELEHASISALVGSPSFATTPKRIGRSYGEVKVQTASAGCC